MTWSHRLRAVKEATGWGLFLLCLAVLLVGCSTPKPPPSQEAEALKKEMLGEINYLVEQLVELVSKQDWEAATQISQESYQKMKKEGQLVPAMIVILDQQGITQVRFPSKQVRYFNFSNYKMAKIVFDKKRKSQTVLYLGEGKIFVLLAPIVQNNKVLGAVALSYPDGEVQKRWKVSEEEFLSLDFNQ